MNKIIEFQNMSKAYGDLEVLKNLQMHVNSGEKLALIGPVDQVKPRSFEF